MNRYVRTGLAAAAALIALVAPAAAKAQGPTVGWSALGGVGDAPYWYSVWDLGPSVYARANNGSGISLIVAKIDGREVARQPPSCSPPCAYATMHLPALDATYPDGRHTVTVEAVDGSGATASATSWVQVDNTPPDPPASVEVEGGTGWQLQPGRRVRFSPPPQQFAPLAAVYYLLCPAGTPVKDPTSDLAGPPPSCVYRTADGSQLRHQLPDDFALPSPGLWTLRIWYVDAAHNARMEKAAVVDLGYDPTPPTVGGFAAQDPNDPARVTVAASDDMAPLAGGSIEVRRRGRNTWRPLETLVTDGGLTAMMPDGKLRRGRYQLRATVTNAAGLQQGTDRDTTGALKALRLPIRLGSRLQAGRRVGKVCRKQGKRRKCRYKLAKRVPVELGRPITLRARLRSQGQPVSSQPLEVWERVSIAGATWTRIGAVQTDKRGRLRYKAPPGVARKLRFRYPGTTHVRGDDATIALRVGAKSTIGVSRRNVINGEYVTFRGKLKGRPIPAEGALVELQVRSRGKWRTFAQPRANANGAWRYQYRFETVSGGARYRFRARVRRQVGYPYATGSSRVLSIRVRGL